ncbi:MAG: hypothetical protein ABL309_10770 [Phycisphaerales bacterium]
MSPEIHADEPISRSQPTSSVLKLWIVIVIFALFALLSTRGMLTSSSGSSLWTFISTTLAWIAAIGLARRNDIGRRAGIVMLIFSLASFGFALIAVLLVELGVIEAEYVATPDYGNFILIPLLFGIVVLHVWLIETLHSKGIIGLMKSGSV